MKTFVTMLAMAGAIAFNASTAFAEDCNQVADAAVYDATHPVASTAIGCGVGAAVGSLLSGGNGSAITSGCAVGGAGGLILSLDKKNQIHQQAYDQCMADKGGAPAPAPVAFTTFAPPSPTAVTPLDKSVNLRAGPGTSNAVLESVAANTTVNVALCSNTGWCQAQTPTNTGWISKSLLSFN